MRLKRISDVMRFQNRRGPESANLVWDEARPDDFDALTGFVRTENLARTTLYHDPGERALKPYDILLVFQGVPSTVGKLGFVIDRGNIVPSGAACIIRAKDCDPFGLYFYLRSRAVRGDFAKMAVMNGAGKKSFLPLEEVRNYELSIDAIGRLAEPGRRLAEEYRKSRERILGMMEEIRGLEQDFRGD